MNDSKIQSSPSQNSLQSLLNIIIKYADKYNSIIGESGAEKISVPDDLTPKNLHSILKTTLILISSLISESKQKVKGESALAKSIEKKQFAEDKDEDGNLELRVSGADWNELKAKQSELNKSKEEIVMLKADFEKVSMKLQDTIFELEERESEILILRKKLDGFKAEKNLEGKRIEEQIQEKVTAVREHTTSVLMEFVESVVFGKE